MATRVSAVAPPARARPLRLERHALGPRLHVLGRRIHEWHAGLVVAVSALVAWSVGVCGTTLALVAGAAGAYLVAKDWRDLFPGTRDSGAWSVGLHRPPRPLRPAHRAAWLPPLSAWLVGGVGAVNIVSAVTPELPGRLHVMAAALPAELIVSAHALTLSAGLGLVAAAAFLRRRRRRAATLAIVLLVTVGALDVVRGLDVEEALLSWALAGLLVWGRSAFAVAQDRVPLTVAREAVLTAAGAVATGAAVVTGALWTAPGRSAANVWHETVALLTLSHGPFSFSGPFASIPAIVGAVAIMAAARIAHLLLRAPRAAALPCAESRQAHEVVLAHGRDSLSFFKLREDLPRLFSADRRAFAAYRIEGGVMLLAGDPVGPADALPGLLREVCAHAERHGLRLGAVGASETFSELARDAGLQRFYVGDEALVDTAAFTLTGKPIKKVRQAVSRVTAAGYTAEATTVGAADAATLATLEGISARWRDGAAERGFSMAMDTLANPVLADTLLVLARDEAGAVRAFLHFVPSADGHTLSLSAMRRDRDTPNGLTDFLVVRSIELARERGIAEVSLNFAAFARVMQAPAGALDRALGRVMRWANPYFQIESLYRYNAKFFPRWQPRYLLFEGVAALPRTALAAMWAEGQLPKPALRLPRAVPAAA
ncbi:phosphatidylglycerol lysyltransferase domain-containing protein [Paraconexibacter antarcticus]|uniref:Phosphatidylglycerol lysyltransferase domain-containing protein n=1 Tax=Paraconexibacter antarcticus TaxID=2949664 RepID=A0ABY5DY82_9ACTN|nr:phosphatidylglycerol lysyltransferase domain-containing protein [Paraconexibacter antarcticus]UTI66121.1 phosphatidylglycerol lysyltransferase domain-containing protein [Paraconexibacter antarcticus]